jgi:hypothetical protein
LSGHCRVYDRRKNSQLKFTSPLFCRFSANTAHYDRPSICSVLSLTQKPYDPFPVPPSCVWHPAPTVVPLGSLGDDQPVVAHPQPGPQPPGVLRPAIALAHRPGRGRHRMHQGRPAAPGAAGVGRAR